MAGSAIPARGFKSCLHETGVHIRDAAINLLVNDYIINRQDSTSVLNLNIFCFLSSSVRVNRISLSCGDNVTFEDVVLTFYRPNNDSIKQK